MKVGGSRDMDPIYAKHGIRAVSIYIFLFFIAMQIFGTISLFITNAINILFLLGILSWELEKEETILFSISLYISYYDIIFLTVMTVGYFKARTIVYELMIGKKVKQNSKNSDSVFVERNVSLLKHFFQSPLDIAGILMGATTMVFWFVV